MKKVLVLALVLGIASMASATLSYSVSSLTMAQNATVTVQIASTSVTPYGVWAGASSLGGAVADITAAVAYDAAGDTAAATASTGSYAGWWYLEGKDSGEETLPNMAIGDHWDITITSYGANGTITFASDSYGTAGGAGGTLCVTVVPEPITIALLGLGGLFLRRRK